MFPNQSKIIFPRYINPISHYKLEEIRRNIEIIWHQAEDQKRSFDLLMYVYQEEKKQDNFQENSFSKAKYVGDGLYDLTETFNDLKGLTVDQIIEAQGSIGVDWLKGMFFANLRSISSKSYPIFWISSELATAIEFTELPEVDFKKIKWFAQSGIIILPKNFLISRNGKEIKAISFVSPTSEYPELSVSCITDDEIVRGIGIDLQENKPRYQNKIVENTINTICKINTLGKTIAILNRLWQNSILIKFGEIKYLTMRKKLK